MTALKIFGDFAPKISKSFLFTTLIILSAFGSFAQPINDDPCAPITLTVNSSCTFQTYTNAAATASGGVPAPGCANYVGGDVWFTV